MNSETLETLAVGDSFTFSGVQWAVRELNYFQDPSGYRTTEWRIASSRRGEYYLMVEYDPAQGMKPVWYLSERLPSPKILHAETGKNIYRQLRESFATNVSPPAALCVNDTTFVFESSSSGRFQSEGESHRTTWEYWDTTHTRNLALEFWAEGELLVYLARVISPDKIHDLRRGEAHKVSRADEPTMAEWMCAIAVTLAGLFMFFKGISR
jgi:hypothetical protein